MKRFKAFILASTLLAMPVAAHAQVGKGLEPKKGNQEESAVDRQKRLNDEKAYKDSLSRVPSKEFDPWSGMRDTEPPKKPPPVKKKP